MRKPPTTEACPTCGRTNHHWDGCSHVECPKRRPWGDATADLELFHTQVQIGQRADIRQPGPNGAALGGSRRRAHIKD